MTTYAIGSVNGDYRTLEKLLQKIQFDPNNDRLWFSGNLVGTATESLKVLRFVKNLGKNAITVLGEQELRLLKQAAGLAESSSSGSFADILAATDRDELLKWLRQRGLIHHDSKLQFTLVHAGIPHEWSFSQALTFAYEAESALSGANGVSFLENHRFDQSRWHAKLRGWKRLNFIFNAYVFMRYCTEQGKLDFSAEGSVDQQRQGVMPWYRVPERNTAQLNIIFADDTGFCDQPYPGIYPLTARYTLPALKLGQLTELISEPRNTSESIAI
ncbi:MAG: symmetrical bis(5'-nucleosyl)-tetraphosphatase [Gammaproteobacteria bacterium]